MPSQCEQLRAEYAQLKNLKQGFALKYQQAMEAEDWHSLKQLKAERAELEQRRDALAEKLWPFEADMRQREVKERYNQDRGILAKIGLLKKLPSGELGVIGIDSQAYSYPKLETIAKEMKLNKETLKTKIEQGFIEIQITPIAQSLDKKIDISRQRLWEHYKEKKLFATMAKPEDTPKFPDDLPFDDETIRKIKSGEIKYEDVWKQGKKYEENGDVYNDENKALWVWNKYKNADINSKLVYYPEEFDQTNHGGKTKLRLIEETKKTAFPGYIVILRENLPNIPKKNKGKEIKGRKQPEAGQNPTDYLKTLKTDPAYKNEIGMTPDDQIIQAMLYLEKHNQVMDDYQGNGSVSYQLGAYFPADGYVPDAYWNRVNRLARLRRYDPGVSDSDLGVRAAVRVK